MRLRLVTLGMTADNTKVAAQGKAESPFMKAQGKFDAATARVDGLVNAPFLAVESKISRFETKVQSVLDKPEELFRQHVVQPIDMKIQKYDDKVEKAFADAEYNMLEKHLDNADTAFQKKVDRVTEPVSHAAGAISLSVESLPDKAVDRFFGKKGSEAQQKPVSDTSGFASRETDATTSSKQNSAPAKSKSGTKWRNKFDFSLSASTIDFLVQQGKSNVPQNLAWK